MNNKMSKDKQPTQAEMFEQVLAENARLRAALQDKQSFETMEQLRLFIEVAKAGIFGNDTAAQEYVVGKIKEVIIPKVEVKEESKSGF
jgi:hypothetical protein